MGKPKVVKETTSRNTSRPPSLFLLRGAWVYPSMEEAGMMRENWTEGGEDDEEGKRHCRRKRERKREKNDREVKRGTDTE